METPLERNTTKIIKSLKQGKREMKKNLRNFKRNFCRLDNLWNNAKHERRQDENN